ncbi:hypothetical protein [Bacillus cereus]|uniref:hypothetical protein n=1 Tax=Bacillus cereus TaxID=1396 RepID=UPI00211D81C0|nr:hypothetical protein [Bacillus cereus]
MPNTASNEQTYMLIGGLIVLFCAASLVLTVRLAHKNEKASYFLCKRGRKYGNVNKNGY